MVKHSVSLLLVLTLSTLAPADSLGLELIEDSFINKKQSTKPSSPAGDQMKLYFKTDENLYKLDSSGVETRIEAETTGKNLVINADMRVAQRGTSFTATTSVGTTKFFGSGLDDGTFGGTFTDTANKNFDVEIDGTGTPDTFQWRKNTATALGSWTTGVAITGSAQTLSDGVTVTFAATTGHTLTDRWRAWAVSAKNQDDSYTLDRWVLLSDGNDVVDVTQSTDVPTGALNSIALDVETANKKFGVLQILEQKDAVAIIGGTASLSLDARVSSTTNLDNVKAAVLCWSGTADSVTSDIVSAWNAEDTTPTWATDWTAENTPANLNVLTTFSTFAVENISIDTASCANVGVFIWSDVTVTSAGEFLYVTNVKLEQGAAATDFEPRLIAEEFDLSQRYFIRYFANNANGRVGTPGFALGPTQANIQAIFPTRMRINPTGNLFGHLKVDTGTSGQHPVLQVIFGGATFELLSNMAFFTTGMTAGEGVDVLNDSDATAYVEFDAEL